MKRSTAPRNSFSQLKSTVRNTLLAAGCAATLWSCARGSGPCLSAPHARSITEVSRKMPYVEEALHYQVLAALLKAEDIGAHAAIVPEPRPGFDVEVLGRFQRYVVEPGQPTPCPGPYEHLRCLFESDTNFMLEQGQDNAAFRWDAKRLGLKEDSGGNAYAFSVPQFSLDRQTALVAMCHRVDGDCTEGESFLMRKINGKWTLHGFDAYKRVGKTQCEI